MKKICISIAAFLAVFMTGCETYQDNLIGNEVTDTSVSETAPSVFDEVTETAPDISSPEVTTVVSGETTEDTGISINLDYDAIATAESEAAAVSDTDISASTGISSGNYTSEDGRPPLSDDLKDFYTSALEVYSKIYYCSFTSDTSTPVWVNGKNG
ncbi:MAG TPA: hypothetical protein DCS38_01125, partial [Ruminococcus sp.]|nr:hypothetical protein [Ruminococcus sp.]